MSFDLQLATYYSELIQDVIYAFGGNSDMFDQPLADDHENWITEMSCWTVGEWLTVLRGGDFTWRWQQNLP